LTGEELMTARGLLGPGLRRDDVLKMGE